MPYTPKPGDVSIFKNRFKDNDRKPDWKGEMLHPVTGKILAIALWEKNSANGKFFSGKVEIPRQQETTRDHSAHEEDPAYMVAGRGENQPNKRLAQMIGDTSDLDDEVPF